VKCHAVVPNADRWWRSQLPNKSLQRSVGPNVRSVSAGAGLLTAVQHVAKFGVTSVEMAFLYFPSEG
jgi:hypothetical protein